MKNLERICPTSSFTFQEKNPKITPTYTIHLFCDIRKPLILSKYFFLHMKNQINHTYPDFIELL